MITDQDIKDDEDRFRESEWLIFFEKLETWIESIIIVRDSGCIEDAVNRNNIKQDLIKYLVSKRVNAP